jgi:hypothetical protein
MHKQTRSILTASPSRAQKFPSLPRFCVEANLAMKKQALEKSFRRSEGVDIGGCFLPERIVKAGQRSKGQQS